MEQYVIWLAKLDPFYRLLLVASLLVGIAAFGTGVARSNPVFVGVACFWLFVAPAVVRLTATE